MQFFSQSPACSPSTVWQRISSSWITTAYFILIAFHSIAQIALHAQLYVSDNKANDFVSNIVSSWNMSSGSLPVLGNNGNTVHLCSSIPAGFDGSTCSAVYDPSLNGTALQGSGGPPNSACLLSLNYPVAVLNKDLREDAVVIALQIWIWGIAVAALLQRSVPLFFARVVGQLAATIIAAIRLSGTMSFHEVYDKTITKGACNGLDMLPRFWGPRWGMEVASLTLNVIGLLAACALTWKVLTGQDFQSFKEAGKEHSKYTNRIYKVFVVFSATIQVLFFFQIATLVLWVDQMSRIGQIAGLMMGNKVGYIMATIVSVPWLLSGWVAVRQEKWRSLLGFLGVSFIFVALWSVTFAMMSYQWTIVSWPIFGFLSIFTFALVVSLFVTGIVCAANYGKGVTEIRAVHESPSQSRSGSIEKRNMSWDVEKGDEDAIERPVPLHAQPMAAPHAVSLPTLSYATYGHQKKPSMTKARQAAMARSLQITPPPLN